MMKRLLLRWLLGAKPAELEPLVVHRGERELCAGTAFLGAPSTPVAKLSYDEALRCFGVHQGK
ncbi:hypothetical protein [Methylobacterium sp. NEAU K]|uniref:hypothetical protein n=1 Tax=Methylobacterium sp. NEAU K TaxID=3064946 RepID=UPI0027362079|nr:hypothetical protein [Methylobacterium sp. NEAU K]MDP4005078.1 hypothetical protein [Methylobacterium sp. NEAU K]